MNKTLKNRLCRIKKAFIYSYNGILYAFRSQFAFQEIIFVFVLANMINYFTSFTTSNEKLFIFVLTFIPIITEIGNSAIENLADAITKKHNEHIKNAKDCASAMTLIALFILVLAYCIIVYNHF